MSAANSNSATSDEAYCNAYLRENDRDRWLACLFAPARHRAALTALYAFNAEIERVRDHVSEPLPGEVRLQWWRDMLEGQARGNVSGNPVAAQLGVAIQGHHLPVPALMALVEAHVHDLYDDLLPTVTDLEGYCGETSSALFRMASLVIAEGADAGPADLAGHAGVAYGIAHLIKHAARHAARGQIFVPAEIIDRHGDARDDILNGRYSVQARSAFAEFASLARKHLALAHALINEAPPAVVPAFVGLGLVEPMLRRTTKPGFDLFRDRSDAPQWLRQWQLWRFSRR